MAELEENLKVYQVQILNFFNRQRYLVIAAGGFELRLLDKTGSGDYKMEAINNDFVKELNKRPELSDVFSFFSASFPQYMMKVDLYKRYIEMQ
jgi:HAE1 family hydrophobic/amphiphilic exporter-1